MNITSANQHNDTSMLDIKAEDDDEEQFINLKPKEVELLIQQKYKELEALKNV